MMLPTLWCGAARWTVVLAGVMALPPVPAAAQRRGGAYMRVYSHAVRPRRAGPPGVADPLSMPTRPAVALRSLLVPGWGQHTLGQRRAWAYAALEAGLWALWLDRRGDAADARSRYRDLAWREARGGSGIGADGDWAYYEVVSKWTRSGAFDANAGASGVQPEEDATTYNGSIWKLARDLYLPGGQRIVEGQAFHDALSYYEKRAYRDGFLWDWSAKGDALQRYKDLIRRSDGRFRQATATLGAVLANHVLAGADAFVSARVPGSGGLRLLPPPPGAPYPGWRLVVQMGARR